MTPQDKQYEISVKRVGSNDYTFPKSHNEHHFDQAVRDWVKEFIDLEPHESITIRRLR